ncbi:hypothetical protein [Paenarthrobacter nicotinovorans]|jgi:hypothetical protein|uniref:hypothetical protein n=2 Tax=Paenarthrobacter TaxID=1742992 RepID=UPI0011870988|nr:hypothetical protein [Paenarthrobacter nicotinovorans]
MKFHNSGEVRRVARFKGRSSLSRAVRSVSAGTAIHSRSAKTPFSHFRHHGNRPLVAQAKCITLIHGADKCTAVPGETVIFTAWIMNDSTCHLRNIRLIPRSFTNEAMEPLVYTSSPDRRHLSVGSLAPGEGVMRSFSYRVTESDHVHGGSLVSAMQVRAWCRGQEVVDEHDAIVALSDARLDWLPRSSRPGLGYWASATVTSVSPRRRPHSPRGRTD